MSTTRSEMFSSAEIAFDAVYEAHASYVHAVLRRFGVPTEDARDISQEVFVALHLQLPHFERRSKLRTWLYSICANKVSDYRNKARRCREAPTEAPPEREAQGDPEQSLLARQSLSALQQALTSLPSKFTEVFVLHDIEERPMSEIVDLVGCPLFTGYTRLRSARSAIQALCANQRGTRAAVHIESASSARASAS
jgi:RNA polymerase sigma-70 factor (ECF subfamily)